MSVKRENKGDIIKNFKEHDNDTGSTAVQIALLTDRINNLTEHFKAYKKDHNSRRGMLKLVGKRRRLLNYLKASDIEHYKDLINKLNLRR